MRKNIFGKAVVAAVALAICLGCDTCRAFAQSNGAPRTAAEAIKASRETGQYLFLLIYETKDALYDQMKASIIGVLAQTDKKILVYEAPRSAGTDRDVIAQYKIDRAPMPLVMVMGPNGAVLGGFPKSVTADKLAKSLVPPLTMDVLKSLQQQKMAVVLLQNGSTKFNAESARTANDLVYDKRLLGSADVITADPSDPKNGDFLANAKIAGTVANSMIVLIAPPGIVAGVFPGNTNKNSIMSSLSAASSGGCAGGSCGPGGCS